MNGYIKMNLHFYPCHGHTEASVGLQCDGVRERDLGGGLNIVAYKLFMKPSVTAWDLAWGMRTVKSSEVLQFQYFCLTYVTPETTTAEVGEDSWMNGMCTKHLPEVFRPLWNVTPWACYISLSGGKEGAFLVFCSPLNAVVVIWVGHILMACWQVDCSKM